MVVLGWSADYADPDNYLRLAVSVLQDGWENTRYEQLLQGARKTTSQEQRLQLYRTAENILLEEMPLLPVYYRRDLGLLKPWVKKAPYLPMHEEVWFWEDIILEPH
jgi:oligopeptide transport system substrate-binding protein